MIDKHHEALITIEVAITKLNSIIIDLHAAGYIVAIKPQPIYVDCNTCAAQLTDVATGLQFEIPALTP